MGLKIKMELDLEDFLTSDFDYDEKTNIMTLKEDSDIIDDISRQLVNEIKNKVICSYEFDKAIEKYLKENKDEIADGIIKNVSDRIIRTKRINDFKKTSEEN